MPDHLTLAQRIAETERSITHSDAQLRLLMSQWRPAARQAVRAHGKVIALSAVGVVAAGVVLYPRRAALMGNQFVGVLWRQLLSFGVPWMVGRITAPPPEPVGQPLA